MSSTAPIEGYESFTIAWIAALSHERAAGEAMFDVEYDDPPSDFHKHARDPNAYSWGKMGKHNVVITSLPKGEYGTNMAATIAQGLLSSLPHIRVGLLVGIGAGIPGEYIAKGSKPNILRDIRLGDVVVSSPDGTTGGVVQIDMVKVSDVEGAEILERKGSLGSPPLAFRIAVAKLEARHRKRDTKIPSILSQAFEIYPKMRADFSHPGACKPGYDSDFYHARDGSTIVREARRVPAIHYGIIASGNTLEKSAKHRDATLTRLHKENIVPICFEMEAAGIMNNFPCLVIRGICDYADEYKNDDWQEYAAANAAAFAKELLECVDVDEIRRTPGIGKVLDKIESVHHDIRQIHKDVSIQRQDSVLDWLCPLDYFKEFEDHRSRCHPGTGQWFLQHPTFLKWVNANDSCTLFCPGDPGTGKTILSTLAIEKLLKKELGVDGHVLFVYCNYKQQDEQTSTHFIASMLRQLAFSSHDVYCAAKELQDHPKRKNSRLSREDLQSLLESAFKMAASVYIIIDALDECRANVRRDLLTTIRGQIVRCKLRLLATARLTGESEVHDWMDLSLRVAAARDDIEKYIEHRTVEFLVNIRADQQLMKEIVESVADAADEMFLLARLHIDALQHEVTPNGVRETLRKFRGKHEVYSAAYEAVMERVESQQKPYRDLAMRIFAWVVHAKRPLGLVELQHALATRHQKIYLDTGDFISGSTVIMVCAGLLSTDEKTDTVRLVHFTAQQYFEKTWRQWFADESIRIADVCITYLSFASFSTGYCSTKDKFNERLQDYRLLEYAARHWGDHYREVGGMQKIGRSTLRDTALSFLFDKDLVSSAAQIVCNDDDGYKLDDYSPLLFEDPNTLGIHLTSRFGAVDLTEDLIYGGQAVDEEDCNFQTPLLWAVENGHHAVVQLLLDSGADANDESEYYGNALNAAATYGHKEVVRILLSRGAEVNANVIGDGNPLYVASAHGNQEVVKLLLEHSAKVYAKGGHYGNALEAAAADGHDEIVRILLSQGAKVNPNVRDKDNPLYAASANGHPEVVKMLLENVAKVSAKGRHYGIALQAAVENGHGEVVQILLSKGADVNAKVEGGCSPLYEASAKGNPGMVKILLSEGADINATSEEHGNALYVASRNGHKEVVQLLLRKRADINAKGGPYGNALQAATESGHKEVVEILLIEGAETDARSKKYGTALQAASAQGNQELVDMLLRHGAKVNADAGRYGSALQAAFANGREEIAETLLNEGARIDNRDEKHGIALYTASSRGFEGIVQTLLRKRADVNAQGGYYGNALQAASAKGYPGIIRVLLDGGAKVSTKGGCYGSALCAASAEGHEKVVQMLLSHDADINTEHEVYGTALQAASAKGHQAVVQLLLEYRANVNAQGGCYGNVLLAACTEGHEEVVRLLLCAGADVDFEHETYGNALQVACDNGQERVAQLLLDWTITNNVGNPDS